MLSCSQRTLEVRPKASVEIPFMFSPAGLTRHSCFLHVRSVTTSRYQVSPREGKLVNCVWVGENCGAASSFHGLGDILRIDVQPLCMQGLTWTYELNGIGEARASVSLGSLRCRARDRLEEHLPIELAGAAWSDSDWSAALGGVKLEIIYPKDR
jgi:hypothetical protein